MSLVSEGILLLSWMEHLIASLVSEHALHLVRVDNLSNIRVGEHFSSQEIVFPHGTGTSDGTELLLEFSQSTFSEDQQSTELSSRGKGLDVKSVNVEHVNALNVSHGSNKGLCLVGDNQKWASSLLESLVPHLSSAGSHGFGLNDSLDVFVEPEGFQQSDGVLGLGNLVDSIVPNKRELRHAVDSVSSGGDKSPDGGGSQSRSQSVSSLSEIDFSVPPSPRVEREGHSSLPAHVTKCSLTTSRGTGTSDTRDSGNGSAGSPGLG